MNAEQAKGWHEEAKRFALVAQDGRVPKEILEATAAAVARFRAGKPAATPAAKGAAN